MTSEDMEFEMSCGNVFEDLELSNAEEIYEEATKQIKQIIKENNAFKKKERLFMEGIYYTSSEQETLKKLKNKETI